MPEYDSIKNKQGEEVNPATEDTLQTINTRMAKDAVRVEDRTTNGNEFIASGMEVAFNNYTVSSGDTTYVRGGLYIFNTLTVNGRLKVEGFMRVGI